MTLLLIWWSAACLAVCTVAFAVWAVLQSVPLEFGAAYRGAAAYRGGVPGDIADVLHIEVTGRADRTLRR